MRLILKIFLWLLLVGTGMVVLFYSEEYLRGRWAWERHVRDLAARGISLDIKTLIPPPVPDAENVAAAPLFAELFATNLPGKARLTAMKLPKSKRVGNEGWRAGLHQDLSVWREVFTNDNLLVALERYASEMKEVEAALQRPKVRFPVGYERGYEALVPHGPALLNLGKIYNAKALAEVEAGQMANALRDLKTMFRLGGLIKDEPSIIMMLVRVALYHLPMQSLWDGLAAHAWSDEQLGELQRNLEQVDLLAHLEISWMAERGMNEWLLQTCLKDPGGISVLCFNESPSSPPLIALWPRGWFYQNALRMDAMYDEKIMRAVNVHAARISPRLVDSADNQINKLPYNVFNIGAKILLPVVKGMCSKVAAGQTYVSEAAVACALERYWLQHRRYPAALAELVPQFLAAVPHDVVDGQPLRYRLDGEGGFVLYSIGWDLVDDGGTIAWKKTDTPTDRPKLDLEKGDWVWRSRPVTNQVFTAH
ncbi:MAG: hypothetical protein NTY53_05640 [Kiritimatiellaeota bacterium]|nr:hypothetical protein [Kiritimatiellota bacterium]